MLQYDYHMHTNYSIDSDEPMENVIKKAIDLGLKEIALTDHNDYMYPNLPFPHQINYDDYIAEFNRLKDQYSNQIYVNLGVEIGIGPHLGQTIKEFVKQYQFDFIIGSIHDIWGVDLYYGNFFSDKEKITAYNEYFQYLLDSIKIADNVFCVLGHLDYISRYGPYADPSVHYNDYIDIIDQLLRLLIANGKGLEINTSGYRYGINNVYPQLEILKRYKQLGGEIITIGSDAHKKEDISKDFDKAYEIFKAAGFKYLSLFRKLEPTFITI